MHIINIIIKFYTIITLKANKKTLRQTIGICRQHFFFFIKRQIMQKIVQDCPVLDFPARNFAVPNCPKTGFPETDCPYYS